MRPRLWFDGEPDRFARMLALLPKTRTATVKYPKPDPLKVRLNVARLLWWRRSA